MHSPTPCLDGWVTVKIFFTQGAPRGLQILWLTVVQESWSAVQGVHMPKLHRVMDTFVVSRCPLEPTWL